MLSDVLDAIVINIPSPDGTMNVVFAEHEGKPVKVEIYIGKAGTTLRAWATCFAELMSMGLQNGIDIDTYCNMLIGQTSGKAIFYKPGIEIKSGPEAVGMAILKYKHHRYSLLSKELGLEDDDERLDVGYFRNPERKDLDK